MSTQPERDATGPVAKRPPDRRGLAPDFGGNFAQSRGINIDTIIPRKMEVPVPDTLGRLWIYLHECAHFRLNHRNIIKGTNDYSRAEAEAELEVMRIFDEEVRQVSATSGTEGRHSTTESVAYHKLAPANVLREMRPGKGILVYGHLPPTQLALRPWFKERRLRQLARLGRRRPEAALS